MEKDKKFVIRCRAIILHEGKLLLVRHPHDTSFAALPGGHLEWGEDVKKCLTREIIEELGIKPELGRLLYVHTYADGETTQSVEFFFEVTNGNKYVGRENVKRSHAYEIAEIVWASPTDDIRILPKSLAEDFKAGKILLDQIKYIKG
jgi:ADP-ribose pyrophosphatase YjhB (NUDIX family)